jgi:lipid II:glycine glycyltransferase (peptidoglycan interpeptide bridge formation enzyme)
MSIFYWQNKNELNAFLAQQPQSQFLQSWQWAELQAKAGHKIWRLGVKHKGEIVASAVFFKNKLLNRSYFYCPRGPVIAKQTQKNSKQILNELFAAITEIAAMQKAIFFRFEPEILPSPNFWRLKKTLPVQPAKTIVLNLGKTEKELLAAMHPKTRYNIRLSFRRGVKVEPAGKEKFAVFWRLLQQTSQRDHFRLHFKKHYERILDFDNSLEKAGKDQLVVKLFLAYYQDKVLAANMVAFFGDSVVYMHGASANELRNLMAPYAVQWQAIKQAKEMGYKWYDFYGIDEQKWPGVTRFKRGFGGQVIERPGTFDLIFSSYWYKVYELFRKIRRKF